MATALRPIGHEDRLSVVDHLGELRTRLVVSAVTLVVAFGICFWQNHALLNLLNQPLKDSTPSSAKHGGGGRLGQVSAGQAEQGAGIRLQQRGEEALARSVRLSPADREAHGLIARGLAQQAAALPKTNPPREPITTGVGEPFTATFTVAAYFALLFSLPILLYQAYAFVLPAFSAKERRLAFPLMLLAPLLFVGGVLFAYFLVLPPAISFLQNFNSENFDILIQAKPYYTFEIFTVLALGLVFQVPIGMLALQRVGIIRASTLTRQWRYAVVGIAVLAAALPGVDPVTTMLEMIPLLLLYGLSIVLLRLVERRRPPPEDGAGGVDLFADFDDDPDENA